MNKQLQDTILSFTQTEPRTIAEVAEHLYIHHPEYAEYEVVRLTLRRMILSGAMKNAPKRKVRTAWLNHYLATTEEDRQELANRNVKVSTPSPEFTGKPSFTNDPLLAAFYSKENI